METSRMGRASARGEVLWQPSPDSLAASQLGAYLAWLAEHGGREFADYAELWQWSVDDLGAFWQSIADWTDTRWHVQPVAPITSRAMPGTRWFAGGQLNYAEHALRSVASRPDETAVVGHSQTRAPLALSWGELADAVGRCRRGLQELGVVRGDRVVAFAPNIPETLVAFLAAASLGAVWSSCAPEFGTRAVVDRFAQVEPTVLVAIDGYRYGTRVVDRRAEVAAIQAALPTLRATVHVPYLHGGTSEGGGRGGVEWAALLATPGSLVFDAVPFDHPLYVLYSSGTTGLPKAIVHGHGGITLEHQKSLRLHHDLSDGDRFAWFTTTGWMMWNAMVSGLLVGSTLVLYDGDPGFPDLGTLWRLAADTDLDVLGVSASFLMACRKAGVVPPPHRLRGVGSTGSPLPADGFRWVCDMVGADVRLASTCGGTDVCAAFLGSSPWLPVRAGEISGRHLGCDVHAFDPVGARCPPGVEGELVVTSPMPTMPVRFWNDDDGAKLRATYFDEYPGVWRHGDWVTFFDDGACVVSGRSDATLNRGGVRLGTSDFYAVVDALPEVEDSLVVYLEGHDDDVMGELLLFVALVPGVELDDGLEARIAGALRSELSPRHVPDAVLVVPSIPRTLSGKKLEVPVKRILGGARADEVASPSSLSDPDSLTFFEHLAAERRR
ncbi:MAG: acetoacetate--CoA ligase [Acidimicrobiia bacterium]